VWERSTGLSTLSCTGASEDCAATAFVTGCDVGCGKGLVSAFNWMPRTNHPESAARAPIETTSGEILIASWDEARRGGVSGKMAR
jgi:hypothetical protein